MADRLTITGSPPAFGQFERKHNALVTLLRSMVGIKGAKVTHSDGKITVEGGGLPAGYTFEEFTICDSGSPATRWMATWTSNPS